MEQVVERRSTEPLLAMERPVVRGKFLYVGEEKFWVRGVSYGTFLVDEAGNEQLAPEVVERDFSRIAENGFNVVRVHLCPPRWLLDTAQKKGLRVMVGLNWGEHMSFIDKPGKSKEIEERMRRWVRSCAGHPAVFCYSVGNEISSSIVRWTGRRRVEEFVKRLYRVAKEEDPDALVTYVNYPSTEYLQLPFLDFLCFNVYLESQNAFGNYIARLHSLSQDRPVLLSEIGLDSLRNGEEKQAETLDWQIRTIFRQGCCGVVVFAWTDEWYHGKYLVEDWKFGLTTRDRTPKLALRAVKRAFLESPFLSSNITWPRISVVACSFNGASTIRETLEGLENVDYPDFEVIVVNDGSTDSTPEIASNYPVRLINTENRGLSQARNMGIKATTGEIVAFIDDDAYPEIHWLRFLALALADGKYVGVGGPNLSPSNDGWKAEAIANAPGPNPVLLSDRVAEHLPGCNMAFRREALEAIDGFDPIFRVAGDDVDLCWRLRDRGGVIGFAPTAVVWHHRRKSIRKYWKQQLGYGKAEALLERKWPDKYNSFGQLNWLGRIYGKGVSLDFSSIGGRVYHGVWGSAPFQSLYASSSSIWSLTLMPEWYLIIGLLALMFALSFGWGPWLLFGASLAIVIALPVVEAGLNAQRARLSGNAKTSGILRFRVTVLFLLLLQPLARLSGRLSRGLTPWRRRGVRSKYTFPPFKMTLWRDQWEAPEATLRGLYEGLRDSGASIRVGGDYDSWDLEVRGGLFGRSRLLLATEEHAPGKQFLRYRITPNFSQISLAIIVVLAAMSIAAGLSRAWLPSITSGLLACLVVANSIVDIGFAGGMFRETLTRTGAT
jgi:GT2 family glycosyltransferase